MVLYTHLKLKKSLKKKKNQENRFCPAAPLGADQNLSLFSSHHSERSLISSWYELSSLVVKEAFLVKEAMVVSVTAVVKAAQ